MLRIKRLITVTLIGGTVCALVYLSVFGTRRILRGRINRRAENNGLDTGFNTFARRPSTIPSARQLFLPEPFKGRQRRLESKCRALFTKNARQIIWKHFPHNQMIIDAKRNFAYCSVEKAGSTFWKSVFARLVGKLPQIKSKEEDLESIESKDDIHEIFLYKLKHYARQNAERFLNRANLMIFVRDPFSRLLSAYMDKLFSPNYHYWSSFGTMIISTYRQNSTADDLRCGHDVTFEEFLEYFVASERKPSVPKDHHWRPIWRLCQPCGMPYRYIGKQETFSSDAKYILSLLSPNSTEFAKDVDKRDSIIKDVHQNVNNAIEHLGRYEKCLSIQGLLERLYSLFVFKGYFKDNLTFETPVLPKVGISRAEKINMLYHFLNTTIAEINNTVDLGIVDDRRLRNSIEWYRGLPQVLRMTVYKLIHPDVVLFGYDKLVDMYLEQSPSDEVS